MQWFIFGILALICWQASAFLQYRNNGSPLLVRGLRPLFSHTSSGQSSARRFVSPAGNLFRRSILWDDRNGSRPDFAFFRAAVRAPPNFNNFYQ